jgi:hypothetical protein
MDLHFVTLVWEKGTSPVSDQLANIGRGEPGKIDSETTQTTPARLDCRISPTVPADWAARWFEPRLFDAGDLYRSVSREHDEVSRRTGAFDPASNSRVLRGLGQ